MSNKTIDELKVLDKTELKYIILQLLIDQSLSYTELSDLYTSYIESSQKAQALKLAKSIQWITSYWPGDKLAKGNFVKAGSAYFIISNNYMKGAGIEKDMKDFLDAHPYTEDDNGMPITRIHR